MYFCLCKHQYASINLHIPQIETLLFEKQKVKLFYLGLVIIDCLVATLFSFTVQLKQVTAFEVCMVHTKYMGISDIPKYNDICRYSVRVVRELRKSNDVVLFFRWGLFSYLSSPFYATMSSPFGYRTAYPSLRYLSIVRSQRYISCLVPNVNGIVRAFFLPFPEIWCHLHA